MSYKGVMITKAICIAAATCCLFFALRSANSHQIEALVWCSTAGCICFLGLKIGIKNKTERPIKEEETEFYK